MGPRLKQELVKLSIIVFKYLFLDLLMELPAEPSVYLTLSFILWQFYYCWKGGGQLSVTFTVWLEDGDDADHQQ